MKRSTLALAALGALLLSSNLSAGSITVPTPPLLLEGQSSAPPAQPNNRTAVQEWQEYQQRQQEETKKREEEARLEAEKKSAERNAAIKKAASNVLQIFACNDPALQAAMAAWAGFNEQAAMQMAAQMGHPARVIRRDGQNFPVTMDYSPNRLNFEFDQGILVGVRCG